MREIKFRAWDEDRRQMLTESAGTEQVKYLTLEGNLVLGEWRQRSLLYTEPWPNDHVLMQYTGLKDKNGVEIYEGDIVRFKVGSGPVVTYPVTWEQNAAQWIKGQCALSSYQKKTEIIGNIYENPELLPGGGRDGSDNRE